MPFAVVSAGSKVMWVSVPKYQGSAVRKHSHLLWTLHMQRACHLRLADSNSLGLFSRRELAVCLELGGRGGPGFCWCSGRGAAPVGLLQKRHLVPSCYSDGGVDHAVLFGGPRTAGVGRACLRSLR